MDINTLTLTQTQTAIYSFTAGYMVSQLNILGFALGCGFMYALNYIPNRLLENNIWKTVLDKVSQNSQTPATTSTTT
jgi:hypothetical protein